MPPFHFPPHPRLILPAGAEDGLLRLIARDPIAQGYYQRLLDNGKRILDLPPAERVLIGREAHYMYMLLTSREILDRIYTLGLLHRLTGQPRWAARAVQELLNAARYVDWNPAHWLDTAEMFHAFAIGYDWLYAVLSPAERAEIEQAALKRGFDVAEKAYQEDLWWTHNPFNWNIVCNGGVIAGALGFAELAPARAEALVKQAVEGLPYALASYAPDGAWAEGPAYWGYASRYLQVALTCLQSALGTESGLGELPGLAKAGYARMHGTGPFGWYFDFADAARLAAFEPTLFWLAQRYANPIFTQAALDSDRPVEIDAPFGAAARALLHYTPLAAPFMGGQAAFTHPPTPALEGRGPGDGGCQPLNAAPGGESMPLDAFYRGTNLVFFRSAWNDPSACYVGFKGGDNQANHSHLDLGVFVFDALGQRWAIELGKDEYTLPGYWETRGRRWGYHRLATRGHNTLQIGGLNQAYEAKAPIIDYGSTPARAWAAADLTAGYLPAGARKVIRRLELGENRSRLLVEDEIELAAPAVITWQCYTQAAVELRGAEALLSQNGRRLRAEILAPAGAAWQVEEMQLDPPQLPLENTRRLWFELPAGIAAQLKVRLTPLA